MGKKTIKYRNKKNQEELLTLFLDYNINYGEKTTRFSDNIRKISSYLQLSAKKSLDISLRIQQRIYRKELYGLLMTGKLEASPSNAVVINNLCYYLNFPTKIASDVHLSILRERFERLASKKNLTVSDENELEKIKSCLCIREDDFRAVKRDICGQIYTQFIRQLLRSGLVKNELKNADEILRKKMELRLDDNIAEDIFRRETSNVLLKFIDRREDVEEVRNMVLFAGAVLRPLSKLLSYHKKTNIIRSRENHENEREIQSGLPAAVITEKSISPLNMPSENSLESQTQKVYYSLRSDMSFTKRRSIYKNFLWHSLIGVAPGSNHPGLELTYLNELRLVLGLAITDVATIHNETLKHVFKSQLQSIASDDLTTSQHKKIIEKLQKSLGLPDQTGQVLIKEVQFQNFLKQYQHRMEKCLINLNDLIKMSAQDIKIAGHFTERKKLLVFEENLATSFRLKTKKFEKELFLVTYPDVLELHSREVRKTLENVAKRKWSSTLVHVISSLRQRLAPEFKDSLWELVLQNRAYTWQSPSNRRREITEIYCFYVNQFTNDTLRHEVAQTLGITNTEAVLLEKERKVLSIEL